jgi:hypothetical protein
LQDYIQTPKIIVSLHKKTVGIVFFFFNFVNGFFQMFSCGKFLWDSPDRFLNLSGLKGILFFSQRSMGKM